MKLYAISDLHLGFEQNRLALSDITPRPDDWLLLVGDIGETRQHLALAFETLNVRFKQIVWVPGNHELWTLPKSGESERGQRKYEQMVALCRAHGVLTPEDSYPLVTFGEQTVRIVPLFLLYDYSFRPAHISLEDAVDWALETGIQCADEHLLHADPYPDVIAWCHARCKAAEARLDMFDDDVPTVLINHFPLRHDLVWIPRIPRFSIWCGTRLTED